jgi:hypothetical protein
MPKRLIAAAVLALSGALAVLFIGPDVIDQNPCREGDGRAEVSA